MKLPALGLTSDLRLGYRALWQHPGLTLAAVTCLALGIGANTTMYSTARALAFHPLPQLREAERLVVVRETPRGQDDGDERASAPVAAELRAERAVFSDVVSMAGGTASVTAAAETEQVPAVRTTASFFPVTGAGAAIGRVFGETEAAGRSRVVVLGHGLWARRFGGDSSVIGRTILVDGEPHTVVGVMPAEFYFPQGTQLWLPLALDPATAADRSARRYQLLARLAPGVSADAAGTAVRVLGDRIARAHPEVSADWRLVAEPAERFFTRGPRPFMLVSLAAVGFVLLIACANVANLLLARATGRRRELALRAALGAGRARIVRQLLVEGLMLAAVGGLLGVLLASWGVDATRANIPAEVRAVMAGYDGIRLDAHSLLFTAGLCVATALVFGLLPALHATRLDVHTVLRAGDRGATGHGLGRVRGVLVVVQLALALVLLVGATLMARTFSALSERDPGFDPTRLLTMRVTLPERGYERPESQAVFFERLGERLRAVGGVPGAGVVNVLPLSFNDARLPIVPTERAATTRMPDRPRVAWRRASTGYFGALGIPLRGGRTFRFDDGPDAPSVAVVSESAARVFWGTTDAVGRRLAIGDPAREVTIVGVIGDARHNVLVSHDPSVAVYVPLRQSPARSMALVVRTTLSPPDALVPTVRRTIAALEREAATSEVFGMPQVAATAASPQRYTARLLLMLAVVAAMLAAFGIYGVMAFAVATRTREIGVRVALGATPRGVLGLVLTRVLALAGLGVALGFVGSLGLVRGLRAILWETPTFVPLTFVALALLLGGVALVAGLIPARRAVRVDPVLALRAE